MWNAEGEASAAEARDGSGRFNVIRKVASALTCWMVSDIIFNFNFNLICGVDVDICGGDETQVRVRVGVGVRCTV